jgi:NADPH-dependent curcumin reductase
MGDTASYSPPMPIGDAMVGRTISRVLQSDNANFVAGDVVIPQGGWQTHTVSDREGLRRLPRGLAQPTLALGPLGAPGFAAHIGVRDIGRVSAGETRLVLAAARPVGATAVQIKASSR